MTSTTLADARLPGGRRRPEREADYRAAIMNDDHLSPAASWIASCLIFHFWQSGELYASQARIAEYAHYSPTSRKTVRSALRELVDAGYLDHVGTKPNRVEHYRFTIPVSLDGSKPEPDRSPPDLVKPGPEKVVELPLEVMEAKPAPEPAKPAETISAAPKKAAGPSRPAVDPLAYEEFQAWKPEPIVPRPKPRAVPVWDDDIPF